MPLLPGYFVYIGSLLMLTGAIIYIFEMFRGQARPNRVTWGLWVITAAVIFISSLIAGGGTQTWLAFAAGFGPLVIFVLSFFIRQSYWATTSFDLIVGLISLAAIALWLITKQPLMALSFAIVADFLACVPTYLKSWKAPASESALAFAAGTLGSLVVLLTVTDWEIAAFAFPFYAVLANGAVVMILLFRRRGLSTI